MDEEPKEPSGDTEEGTAEEGESQGDGRPRPSWKARVRKVLVITAITCALLVFTLELLGRLSPTLLGRELYIGPLLTEPDDLTGKHLRPGTHFGHTIIAVPGLPPEVGLRDNGFEPGAGRRVLALGDSFTFGSGVALDRCWTEVLETKLSVPVVNAGMGGTGPDFARKFLRHYGHKLEPDLVLYAFFAGNDVLDAGVAAGISVRRFGAARHWLQQHSVTYRAAKLVLRRTASLGKEEMKRHMADLHGEDQGFWPAMLAYNSLADPPPSFTDAFARARESIGAMAASCKERETPFAVVIFPYKEQVHFDVASQWVDDPARYDPREPGRTLAAWCREESIPVLDLTETFRKAKGRNLYLPLDTHWNEGGNRLAAESLAPFVKELLEE